MPESNLPAGTADDTALSFEQSVEDITALLPDSDEPNLGKEDAEADVDGKGDEEPGPDDEADAEDNENAEDPDGSEAYSGGRFAADDAKVTLNDGSVVTITDLKRGYMSQQAFTRKTTEHSEERRAFDAERESTRKLAQDLSGERELIFEIGKQFAPKEPDPSLLDPSSAAYDPIAYTQLAAEFNRKKEVFQRILQSQEAERARQADEARQAQQKYLQTEREKLWESMPELKTREGFGKFMGDAVKVMAQYGWTEQEVYGASDHRIFPLMRDLAAFQRAKSKAPQAKQEVQGKPRLLNGSKRMDPKNKPSRDRQGLAERQRRSGSDEDTVARLMNLNL